MRGGRTPFVDLYSDQCTCRASGTSQVGSRVSPLCFEIASRSNSPTRSHVTLSLKHSSYLDFADCTYTTVRSSCAQPGAVALPGPNCPTMCPTAPNCSAPNCSQLLNYRRAGALAGCGAEPREEILAGLWHFLLEVYTNFSTGPTDCLAGHLPALPPPLLAPPPVGCYA